MRGRGVIPGLSAPFFGSLFGRYFDFRRPEDGARDSIATANMLKGGCDFGASGENPVIRNVMDADAVLGPVGIIAAHAMLGEVTPAMAAAVGGCRAPKYLIPVNSCGITVAGTRGMQLNTLAAQLVQQMAADLNGGDGNSSVRYLDHDT